MLSFGFAQQQLLTDRITVLYDDAALEPFAQQIAYEAEQALSILAPLFGLPKASITLKLEDNSDVYNAFATLFPRPTVSLRGLFPVEASLGFGARSELYLLILHELTHITQLGYTGSDALALGLPSDGSAALPPPWFTEGIAVYMETAYTEAGRVADARTLGLLQTKALADDLPELSYLSLSTFSAWPAGAARYLYGGHFLTYLIEKYGFEAILTWLKAYNSGLLPSSFSAAWQASHGSLLSAEWETWKVQLKAEAEVRTVQADQLLTESHAYTSSPALSPSGQQLAWLSGASLMLARLENGELKDSRVVQKGIRPQRLSWLDERTLIYNRIYRQTESSFYELFSLDSETGLETKLSSSARAFFPAVRHTCLLYVKDSPSEGSSLIERCDDRENLILQTFDSHIVGLAVSEQGQIALSVWQDGFVDLALLKDTKLEFFMRDAFQDLEPSWDGEEAILFSSDRTGIFNLFSLDLASQSLTRLSNSPGGAFEPVMTKDGIIYTALTKDGYDLALLQEPLAEAFPLEFLALPEASGFVEALEVKDYNPLASLMPYAWTASYFGYSSSPLGLGLGISVLGQDLSGKHSYALNLAYDSSLTGPLAGLIANLEYGFQDNVDPFRQKTYPFGVQFKAGLFKHYPHLQGNVENALGLQGQLRLTQLLDKWSLYGLGQLGLVYLSSVADWQLQGLVSAILSQRSNDDWNYASQGMRFGLSAIWSASSVGVSPGLWADASYYAPISQLGLEWAGTAEFLLRAGYRQAPAIPLVLEPFAAVATLGYRYSYPLELRYDEGFLALERLTLEPRLRTWFDGRVGLGADLSLSADMVVLYNAPLSLSLTLGYAEQFWYRFGLGIKLD